MGATFISSYIVKNSEEGFYELLGFKHNEGLLPYYIENRSFVIEAEKTKNY
jgi:hypothetical protein